MPLELWNNLWKSTKTISSSSEKIVSSKSWNMIELSPKHGGIGKTGKHGAYPDSFTSSRPSNKSTRPF